MQSGGGEAVVRGLESAVHVGERSIRGRDTRRRDSAGSGSVGRSGPGMSCWSSGDARAEASLFARLLCRGGKMTWKLQHRHKAGVDSGGIVGKQSDS
jgi:hypothetical protein